MNGKTFYKIENNTTFEEKQLVGKKVFIYQIKANQYPEILKIMEMLDLLDPYYESTENEYEQIKGEE